jgi:flagellar hook-associated protein 1 FlgK
MGGLNVAFNTIQSALQADQEAINVTANNVGNANTPGYTNETVSWQETDPITINGQSVGTGVAITSVTSQRSLVLNQAIDQQQQTLSAAQAREAGLTDVETIFPTSTTTSTSGGIGSALSTFFADLSSLEASPSQSSARSQVLSDANALAASFNSAANQLSSQTNSLNQAVGSTVQQINGLTSSLATLNQEITSAGPTNGAGTLEDQRQQDLSQLSQLIGVNQIQTQGNGIELTTTNGTVLVAGNQSFALSTGLSATTPGVVAVYSGSTDISTSIHVVSLVGTL